MNPVFVFLHQTADLARAGSPPGDERALSASHSCGWNTYMVGKWHLTADEMNHRPQLTKPRNRYLYYPGIAVVPESVAPNIRNRSFTVGVEVTIDSPDARGVLFAQGSRFGGHALYVKDGRLKYVYNFVGDLEQVVESAEPLPAGRTVLSAAFEREGDTMPAEGTLTLRMGETTVGRAGSGPSPASSPSRGKGSLSVRTPASR